jgi:hypothetical protein
MGSGLTENAKRDETLIFHDHTMPLALDQVEIYVAKDEQSVVASLYEYPKGCRHWDLFKLSKFPDNFPCEFNYKRFTNVSEADGQP